MSIFVIQSRTILATSCELNEFISGSERTRIAVFRERSISAMVRGIFGVMEERASSEFRLVRAMMAASSRQVPVPAAGAEPEEMLRGMAPLVYR